MEEMKKAMLKRNKYIIDQKNKIKAKRKG